MIKILISNKIELSNSDKIFLKGLEKKIIIEYVDTNTHINFFKYYVENPKNKNETKFTSVSTILRDILETFPNQIDRLIFLKNMFKNEDMVILAPGPSYNYLSLDEKKIYFLII
jgi:hypothetical protein